MTIVTPFGTQAEYDVTQMRAPGTEGSFGVLPGHLPFMTTLKVGAIILDTVKGQVNWATSGGYAEVLEDSVSILAETAERADKIDLERAAEAEKRARERLSEHSQDLDTERARIALARALNRKKIGTHPKSS